MTTPWGEVELDPLPRGSPRPAACLGRLRRVPAAPPRRGEGAASRARSWCSGTVGARWSPRSRSIGRRRSPTPFLGQEATGRTWRGPGRFPGAVRLLTTQDPPPERVDVLLVRVPKSPALLEDQLLRLAARRARGHGRGRHRDGEGDPHLDAPSCSSGSSVRPGPRWPRQKARLISAPRTRRWSGPANPCGRTAGCPCRTTSARCRGRTVVNRGRVLRRPAGHRRTPLLPRGTCRGPGAGRVVDPGCGNGVVGTAVALADPTAEVLFVDESFQAVASAEATYTRRTGCRGTPSSGSGTGWRGWRPAVWTWC